eukprot:3873333-Pyramimonas_sp.AAC.2
MVSVKRAPNRRARHGHRKIDRQDLTKSSYHSREDSILPSILCGRRMCASSPTPCTAVRIANPGLGL